MDSISTQSSAPVLSIAGPIYLTKKLSVLHPHVPFLRQNVFTTLQFYSELMHMFLSLFSPLLPLWSMGHPWNALFHFSFFILRQSAGLLRRGISPSQGRYVHTEQHKHRINAQSSIRCVGFEPTIPIFVRAKTVNALHRAATVIGTFLYVGCWFSVPRA
jgi:hypothetical protein